MKWNQLIICLFTMCLLSCGSGKKSPEYIARQYLLALKNKDWEKAKKYSSNEMDQMLDMMKAMGTDFKITEIKDIKCITDDNNNRRTTCTFCCTSDSTWNEIYLYNDEEDGWLTYKKKMPPRLDE